MIYTAKIKKEKNGKDKQKCTKTELGLNKLFV